MTFPGQRLLVASSAMTVALVGLLPGCSRLRPCCPPPPQKMTMEAEPALAVPSPGNEGQQGMLAAVQEFLERTQDYQRTSAEVAWPAPPAVPPTANHIESPGEPQPLRTPAQDPAPPSTPPPRDAALANTQVTLLKSVTADTAPAIPVVKSISIRTAPSVPPPPQEAKEESPRANRTNQLREVHTDPAAVNADQFVQALKALAAEAQDLDAEWRLRLVQLALNHEDDAIDVSPKLTGGTRTILIGLLRLGLEIRRLIGDPLASGQDALARVDELRRVLADRADPIVAHVVLCRKVVTFGVYEEMAEGEFVAGRTNPAIVYSEIRNLRSEPVEGGQYRTLLGTRIEVLTPEGDSVWQHEEPEIVDFCRRRRNDFFIAQRIALPSTLPPGDLVLKVLVEDKLSGKAHEAARRFTVNPVPIQTARR